MQEIVDIMTSKDWENVEADTFFEKRFAESIREQLDKTQENISERKDEIDADVIEECEDESTNIFLAIYEETQNGELAETVRDDFELLSYAKLLNVEDEVIEKLKKIYDAL